MSEIRSDEDAKLATFIETMLNRYVSLLPEDESRRFIHRMNEPGFAQSAFLVTNDISRCSVSCCFDEADEVQYIFATSYLVQASVLKEEELFDMICFSLEHFDFDVLKNSDLPSIDDQSREIAEKRMQTMLLLVRKIREEVVDEVGTDE